MEMPTAKDCLHEDSRPRLSVHVVNDAFIVFNHADAETLRNTFRIVPDFGSSLEQLGSNPSTSQLAYLSAEQVAVSLEQGFVRLVKHKRNALTVDDSFITINSDDECATDIAYRRELAKNIALGQKMKYLKRRHQNDDFEVGKKKCASDILRTVTEDEVNEAMDKVLLPSARGQAIIIRLCSSVEDNYEVVDFPEEVVDVNFRIRKVVFRDLWSRGYYITSGIRFGCHFLVYEDLPGKAHSTLMVRCVNEQLDHSSTSMLSFARVANQVCKTAVIAFVSEGSQPQYLTLQSFNPLFSLNKVSA